jgi:hypothetical protein
MQINRRGADGRGCADDASVNQSDGSCNKPDERNEIGGILQSVLLLPSTSACQASTTSD